MEWETCFQKRILDRGYDYYFDERVEDLRITSNRIKAVVYGTHPYHVEIKLNGNKIIGMSCDCPYAQDEHNCKHMAAVLYEWQLRVTHIKQLPCAYNYARLVHKDNHRTCL